MCSPDEVRTVRVYALAMEEPYFDRGYSGPDGEVGGRFNGIWDHVDSNGDGRVEKEELFEEYWEVSRMAGLFAVPEFMSPRLNGMPAGQVRGRVESPNYHADVVDRTRLSWDQACILVEVEPVTVYDPGPDFFAETYLDGDFDLLLRGADGKGYEEGDIIQSVAALVPAGSVAVVYTATMTARLGASPGQPTVTASAYGFAASAELLEAGYPGFPEIEPTIELLGDRAVMFVNPISKVSMRVLAHEVGHVLAVQGDPSDPNEGRSEGYSFPLHGGEEGDSVGSMRRLPSETVHRARQSPFAH